MNKITLIKKRKEKYVYTKLMPTQALNAREVELLAKKQVYQLISPEIEIKKKSELYYKVTNLITLKDYLQTITPKIRFLNIVLSILDMLKEAKAMTLYEKNFLLTTDYVFVEPNTKKLLYIYLPVVNYDVETDLKGFFMSLPFETVFNHMEDCTYVKLYMNYFNEHPNFSVYDFEMFIRRLNDEDVREAEKEEVREVQAQIMPNITMYAHPSKKLSQEEMQTFREPGGFVPAGTTVLGAYEEGTAVLSENELMGVVYPYMVRVGTNERVDINKKSFNIGQSIASDYQVTDNRAVSRNHATILIKNNKYYVVDNKSTNGTYIDDKRIEANVENEINPGQKLRFANEEYDFLV